MITKSYRPSQNKRLLPLLVAGVLGVSAVGVGTSAYAQGLVNDSLNTDLSVPTAARSLLSTTPAYIFGERLEQRLFNNWDVKTSLFYTENDQWNSPDELDGLTIDLQRSVMRSARGSVLKLGLGWQRDANDIERSGPRLTVSGRVQFGSGLRLYGQTAWSPDMDENLSEMFDPSELSEIEAGFSYNVIPSVSVRAGVRWYQSESETGSNSLFGDRRFMLGAGVRW